MQWLWLLPVLSFLGALIQAVLAIANSSNSRTSAVLGVTFPALSLSVALAALWQYVNLQHPEAFEQKLFTWSAGELTLDVTLVLDALSAAMIFIVPLVGFWVAVYSAGFMEKAGKCARFYSYLGLLQGALLLMVLAGDLVVFLAGWQAVALASSLVIGLRASDTKAARAAHRAFVIHRIGDVGIILAAAALFARFNTFGFQEIFQRVAADQGFAVEPLWLGMSWSTFVAGALLLAAMTKSSQFPLFAWLPEATNADAPSSAFLNSLVVAAGPYLLVRCQTLLVLAPGVADVTAVMGALTAILAATAAVAQTNLPRALAFATISQIGLVFAAIGVGAFSEAVSLLVSQAFFLALLFLAAGSVSSALSGATDLRSMGGLRSVLPWTSATFLVGSLALAGFPGFAGFFSQGGVLTAIWIESKWLWLIATSSTLAISFSVFRLYWLIFWDEFRGEGSLADEVAESPAWMTVPLVVLAAGSALIGWICKLPLSHRDWLGRFLDLTPRGHHLFDDSTLPTIFFEVFLVLTVVVAAALGILASWRIYGADFGIRIGELWVSRYPRAHRLLSRSYGMDGSGTQAIVAPVRSLSTWLNRAIDSRTIPGALSTLEWLPKITGELVRNTTTGNVRHYALYVLGGIFLLFFWVIL